MIAFKKFITVTAIAVFSMVSNSMAEDFVLCCCQKMNPRWESQMQLFL